MKRIYYILVFIILTPSLYAVSYDDIEELSAKLEKKYSIYIFTKDTPRSTWELNTGSLKEEHYDNLYKYMILFDEEFSKYPKSFIRKTRLRDVSFVSYLSLNGQERTALPDFKREILFYDFLRGDSNTTYQRHVIHHEFYHMIEEDINLDVYWKDPNWAKLNKPGYKYSIDKRMAEENSSEYKFSHPEQGFLNLYSKSALEEDKAEIFASIFVKEEYKKVIEWIKNDEILSNKLNYMKAFLFTVDNSFNESYWNKLHNSNTK